MFKDVEYFLFKYLWVIAVLPKMAQLPILGLIMMCLYIKGDTRQLIKYNYKSDIYFTLLIAVNAIYAFSIVYNTIFGVHELSRIFAAINTFSITCVAYGFYNYYSKVDIDSDKVQKYMFINMCIMLGLAILYYIIGDKGNLPILGSLSGWDFVKGQDTTRLFAYLEYPNLLAFVYLYCYCFAAEYLSEKFNAFICLIIECIFILPLVAARSRTGILCAVCLIIISFSLTKIKVFFNLYIKHKYVCWVGAILSVMIIGFVFKDYIITVLNNVMSYRGGSNSTRMMIYTKSIDKFIMESPIWGCGIKDHIIGGQMYGSHSTYIGMFYKTGIVGGVIYLVATAIAIFKLITQKDNTKFSVRMTFGFLIIFALMILEDLDGANWNIVIFMSLYALFFENTYFKPKKVNSYESSCVDGNI